MISLVAIAACADAPTPREVFDAEVVPVLERRCAATACHGVAPDAAARGEVIDATRLNLPLDTAGRIADRDAAYAAARRAIDAVEAPAYSTLLRKALGGAHPDGLPHHGGAVLRGPDDPAYQAIRGWIEVEPDGGEDPAPLTALERQFADTVQPALAAAGCMTAHCHGVTAGATPYRLDGGVGGRFPIAATRANHAASLAQVALDGDPWQSRLLRKAQPPGPGIAHEAASTVLLSGAGGRAPEIVAWICAERRARTGAGCTPPGAPPITGFVFVRGPVAPRAALDLDDFTPGTDLWLATVADAALAPATLTNLTAALHPDGPADVRDPAVSRDGARVVFAMRTAADHGHRLWLLELATGAARPLTDEGGALPGGGVATDRDPTWGPDGAVWFASTRAGALAERGAVRDAELYSVAPATGAVTRWTYTPHVERKPTFLEVGDAGGSVAFTALRDGVPARARAHAFRFPPSLRSEYHAHAGVTQPQTLFHDARELPDGRLVAVVGELPAPWSAGALAIVDRDLGPELPPGVAGPAAVERYLPPRVVLPGDGAYRDPAPLPDGRLLVAHQPAPFDPADPAARFAPRLELLELGERPDGGGPTVARAVVLLDEPGVALTDPEPVALRAPVRADGAAPPPATASTAVFRHQGLPMIDALLVAPAPVGVKRPRDDLAAVRLVEHLPVTRAQRAAVPPDETLFGVDGASTVGLGPHGPARILGELPLAADGSFQVEVPAGVAFRLQALDAAGVATGAIHDRWFYGLPGQVITQGVSTAAGTARYGARCAGCHGDPDGVAGRAPAMEPPDALTGASWSLARYAQQDPRRPLAPPALGDATRVTIDFRRDVQPILDRRCGACHAGAAPAAGLDLSPTPTAHFTVAYEHLLRPGDGSGGGRALVDDHAGRADRSYLIERVTGVERAAPRALPAPGRPHPDGAGRLTDDEVGVLVRWVDLGATFVGAPPPP